jgi:hypothetical protein
MPAGAAPWMEAVVAVLLNLAPGNSHVPAYPLGIAREARRLKSALTMPRITALELIIKPRHNEALKPGRTCTLASADRCCDNWVHLRAGGSGRWLFCFDWAALIHSDGDITIESRDG